jgi:hypothetical protein
MSSIQITSTNYNGQTAQVTFYSEDSPSTAVNLGSHTIPYVRTDSDVYGTYELNFAAYSKICSVSLSAPTTTTTAEPTTTTTTTTTTTAAPGGGYLWSGFNGGTDYNGDPYPQSLAFSVAGTFDGVDYYSVSINVQTGPEAYMISTIVYYMYRTTHDETFGTWQIREDTTPSNSNQGPPFSYIYWYGTPTSTPPLSGWSNGSLT